MKRTCTLRTIQTNLSYSNTVQKTSTRQKRLSST